MSIHQFRRSLLIATGIAALGAVGLVAGRLSAGAMPGRGHRDFAVRMFQHLSKTLDLADDQKTRIKGILKAHASEIESQIRASGAARRALHQAILAEPADEAAIRSAAARLGTVQGDGSVLFAKLRAEVDPVLTDDQRARVRQLRDRVRGRTEAAVQSFEAFLEER